MSIREESVRQAYLRAMGIDCWLPVGNPPGAAPSVHWSWRSVQPAEPPPVAPVRQPSRQPAPPSPGGAAEPRRAARLALKEPLVSPPETSPPVKPQPSTNSPAPSAEGRPARSAATPRTGAERPPVPRFVLSQLLFADTLVWVELPPAAGQGLSPQHRQLLGAILRAVGVAAEQPQREERFRWPILENAFLDMGAAVARAALQDRLRQLRAQAPVARLLLFGEATLGLILDRTDAPEQWRGQLLPGPDDLPTLATLSLHQILALPQTKAEVWRHLQPLRAPR